ncbi:MAG: TRAP transporter substrate-binding protein DctP [Verrucomicrobiia bacterium]|jgi:TRAP-type C4-dicarboxylate transport system substrate-binding protein
MRYLIAVLSVLWATGAFAADAPIKIKLGTLAPKDSSPHQSLKAMAEKWRQAPGGGVQLTIFTDGTQGGEADMVRRMRIGQLQAAMLTGTGMAEIDDSVTALQTMPMVYRSLDEVDYVREKLRPKLEQRLADKGFVVLFLADAGWVKFFSRKPVVYPDDLKRQKLFAWAGDNKALEIMKAAGYQPIPLETADILPGLQTGLIDAVPAPPFFALAGQFYGPAPHMLDMNWAPLVGACVITKKTWDKIPSDAQKAMREAAEKAGDEVRAQARKEMTEAVKAMKKRGLVVHELTPEAETAWRGVAESVYPKIRGTLVPADMFDEVQALLAEYRAGKK